MSKVIIMTVAAIGMTIGAFVPFLWGDRNMLGGMSILFGMIGGFVGIWVGVKVSKLLS